MEVADQFHKLAQKAGFIHFIRASFCHLPQQNPQISFHLYEEAGPILLDCFSAYFIRKAQDVTKERDELKIDVYSLEEQVSRDQDEISFLREQLEQVGFEEDSPTPDVHSVTDVEVTAESLYKDAGFMVTALRKRMEEQQESRSFEK